MKAEGDGDADLRVSAESAAANVPNVTVQDPASGGDAKGSGAGARGSGSGNTVSGSKASQGAGVVKRTVCDHCRRRRIRCDGQSPCQQCTSASLICRREHVPRKRGPKRGHGRVIDKLRATDGKDGSRRDSRDSSMDLDIGTDEGPQSAATSVPSTPPLAPADSAYTGTGPSTGFRRRTVSASASADHRHAPEPRGAFASDQFRPTSRSYLHLIPQCVDLYYEHIYPIMPLPYMPTVRTMIASPPTVMTPSERNFIYALCALTSFHMSGQSVQSGGPPPPSPSWEAAGRFFLDECIAVRQSYDFLEDASLKAVMSSFWLSTSFFEINQNRKSWLYLREALTLAQDMGLHDDATYVGLGPEELLCRQRVFWQLFVTERSFAVLRNKPITLKKTPSLPTTRHAYEAPDIHSGFIQLISSYVPLDESFVAAWNDGSDPRVSATTYLALQNLLAVPPPFVAGPRSGTTTPSSQGPGSRRATMTSLGPLGAAPTSAPPTPTAAAAGGSGAPSPFGIPPPFSTPPSMAPTTGIEDEAATPTLNPEQQQEQDQEPVPEPTAIQKADLLITQQWLRLIVWRSSFRQGLLSCAAPHESMHFAFPLAIARRTAAVLQSLPGSAVEVHGMGIFEKIFEIGTWCINVLGACDDAAAAGPGGGGGGSGSRHGSISMLGMDFGAGGDDLGVLGVGRLGFAVDPLEFFVRTLSASPNSRTQFAERLLMFASERPGGMRMALSPSLSAPSFSSSLPSTPGACVGGAGTGMGMGMAARMGVMIPLSTASSSSSSPSPLWSPAGRFQGNGTAMVGSVLGEVADDARVETAEEQDQLQTPTLAPGQGHFPLMTSTSTTLMGQPQLISPPVLAGDVPPPPVTDDGRAFPPVGPQAGVASFPFLSPGEDGRGGRGGLGLGGVGNGLMIDPTVISIGQPLTSITGAPIIMAQDDDDDDIGMDDTIPLADYAYRPYEEGVGRGYGRGYGRRRGRAAQGPGSGSGTYYGTGHHGDTGI